jgi:uncharacterized protein (TIGR02284 family)
MTTTTTTMGATTANTMDESSVISTLNNLIATCRDGQNGFESAAEGITDAAMKGAFHKYAQQRSQFAAELQSEVRMLGGDPETTGSVAGALHRGWINIKAAVTGKDEHSILEECERGEDSAKENYREAMEETLPPQVLNLVNRQYHDVIVAHDTIRSWRDRTKAANA